MIKSVYLFTNRNCLIFDENGEQISELQAGISCYTLDVEIARKVAREAEEFYMARWARDESWCHPIPRQSFEYLLGIRTREMDIADK